MLTPAQRHMMRVSAAMQAQREHDPLRQANGYEKMLFQLATDKRTLKQVRSMERKAEIKRGLVANYAPYVAGVLSDGRGAQDAVLMTLMVWRLDAGDITGALEIARYALHHKLVMPFGTRTAPYLLAEEVAESALRAYSAGQSVNPDHLLTTLTLTDEEDMPDQVRAKLHKSVGVVLRDGGKPEQGLTHLKRAFQLDSRSGVKKDIERLETVLRKAAARR